MVTGGVVFGVILHCWVGARRKAAHTEKEKAALVEALGSSGGWRKLISSRGLSLLFSLS